MRRSIGGGFALLAAAAASFGAAGGCAEIAGLEEPPSGVSTSSGGAGPGSGGAGGAGGHGGAGGSTSNTGGGGSGAGGSCDPGPGPVAVVTGQKGPTEIAADASGVYWVTEGEGPADYGVWKMDAPCGPAVQMALPDQRKPLAIAVDGSNVYWSESGKDAGLDCTGNDPTERERIMRVAKVSPGGTGPGDFFYGMCGDATSIALNEMRAYWTRPSNSRVQSTLKETGGFLGLWYDAASRPQAIVADGPDIYWSDPQLGAIYHYGDSGQAEALVQSAGSASHIALDDAAVYWIASDELRSNPRGTPNAVTPLSTDISQAAGIATDDASPVVYVADTGAARILKIPKDGSAAPEPIPTDPSPIGGVALDGTYVYWTHTNTGEIWRAPR